MNRSPRVLLLGWDAADWKVIRPLLAEGAMPNLAGLMARGVHGNHSTIYPVLSPMLWTSISTGKRPPKHGVLGFSEPTGDGRGVRPCSILSRKTKAVWNILAQEGKRSVVVGWWPSFPAEPIPGAMVSNHFQQVPDDPDAALPPLVPGTVSPERVAGEISDLRVRPWEIPSEVLGMFVPRFDEVDQEKDKSLHDLAKILAETLSIHAAATDLLEREPWDFAAVYFDTIDHASHRFMQYHPPRQARVPEREFEIYKDIVANVYRHHDAMLGRYLELAGPGTHVIVVSDHGFHSDDLRPGWIPAEPAGPAVEHRHFGMFVMAGPGIRQGERIFGSSILDVAPTVLTLFGLPVGEDMDGAAQIQAWDEVPEVRRIPTWDDVPGADGRHPEEAEQDPRAAAAALEQMVALGYIAPLPDNAAEAVRETTCELDYNLARALADAGKPHEAARIFERLWDEWPREHRFGLHLLDALARTGRIPERRAALDKLKIRAEEFAAEAKAKLESLPKEEADPVEQRHPENRRKQFERRGYHERAAGLVVPILREEIAQCLLEGNKEEAERQLDGLLEGGNLPYWLAQFAAEKLVALDRGDEALPLLDSLLAADPENPGHEALRAEIFYRKRDWDSLVDASAEALGLVYFNPRLHMLLGLALLQLGRTEDATNELLVAVRQNPGQLPALEALEGLFRHDPARAIAIRSMSETLKANMAKMAGHRMRADEPPLATYEFAELCDAPPAPGEASDGAIIVTGLPRSGTSLLMRTLEAGGIPVLADAERPPDESNRLGYFEFTPVKTTARDASWIGQAKGKAVKVVAPLLRYLPSMPASLIVLHRPLAQVLASQEAMKARLGAASQGADPLTLSRQFATMMDRLPGKLAERPDWRVLHVSFEAMLDDPAGQCARIAAFLGPRFDPARAASAVDPAQRRFSS
ncbi:MAG: alkaline phosphatase family protein [Verrucomicrobiae bacterium]